MTRHVLVWSALFGLVAGGLFLVGGMAFRGHGGGGDDPSLPAENGDLGETHPITTDMGFAVKPKPIGDTVNKGLKYLISQQHEDGGWGQGGGWRSADQGGGRVEGAGVQDPSDVGNTCIATLALLRAGNTPSDGPYARNVARAIQFICKNVDKADKDSLWVTPVRNTQLQSKIGPYIDTFMASLVMAEVKGKMGSDESEKQLLVALDKTVHKIEKNQKANGTWANEGWAAVISQGIATKGLNRAKQVGVVVSDEVLVRAEKWGKENFDARSGTFGKPGAAGLTATEVSVAGAADSVGDAGVPLYSAAQTVSSVQESVNTNRVKQPQLKKLVAEPSTPAAVKDKAQKELDRFGETEKVLEAQTNALSRQISDQAFVQGFGSNGGEEFLSYLNISETLLVKGGKDWEKWDKTMSEGLTRAQDKDGSWSGAHCITGKTFCTAAAMLVLMADRAPVPVAAKMKETDK